jgi:hypothetical protein
MSKKIILSGLLGGLTLIIWMVVISGIFGFRSMIDMKQIPDDRQVYELLKSHITEPGRYLCNPELTSERIYPEGKPVFSILYSGLGHEAAGEEALFGLLFAFCSTIIGAYLLSLTSDKIISSYPRKVLFFTIIGLLIAIFSDFNNYGIDGYPFGDALLLGINDLFAWTVVGLVVAWYFKPQAAN